MPDFEIGSSHDGGIDEVGAILVVFAVASVDVSKDVKAGLDSCERVCQERAAEVKLPTTWEVEDSLRRSVGDEDVEITWDGLPVSLQFFGGLMVGEAGKVGNPR